MPSINAFSTMASMSIGAGVTGSLAFKRSANDQSMDLSDRVGYATSLAGAGAVLGLGAKSLGVSRLGSLTAATARGARTAGRVFTANPSKALFKAAGRTKFGWNSAPKPLRGVLLALSLSAAATGGIAYGSRDTVEKDDVAVNSGANQVYIQSVRDRLKMLGTTGDMVFGLNNMRHG